MSFIEIYHRRDKKKFYRQCMVSKGDSRLTTWVEKGMARVGVKVAVNDDLGWVIEEVYDMSVSGEFLDILEGQYKRNREETDI